MEKMRQWSLLTGLGVVGVLAAGWFLLVSPQHSHAKDLRTQAAAVQSTTAGLEAKIGQLKAQQTGVAAQQRTLAHIATQIPDNPALPTLIRQLSAAAHNTGVTLVSLAPSPPSPVSASTAVTSPTSTAAAPLEQIAISVQVTGSYFNIESFFRAVEHLDRAMMNTGFTLSPSGTGGTTTNTSTGASTSDPASAAPGALNAQVQAVVFMSPAVAVATTPTAPQTPTTTGTTAQTPATTGTTAQTPTTTASTAPAATPAQ